MTALIVGGKVMRTQYDDLSHAWARMGRTGWRSSFTNVVHVLLGTTYNDSDMSTLLGTGCPI